MKTSFVSFMDDAQADSKKAIPVVVLSEKHYSQWLGKQSQLTQQWLKNNAFDPKKGTVLAVPNVEGKIEQVIVGLMHEEDVWVLARVASLSATGLPAGCYQVQQQAFYADYTCFKSPLFYLAWGLEQYRFTPYKPSLDSLAYKSLLVPHDAFHLLNKTLTTICWVRDLINTPAETLNPITLEEKAKELAKQYHASFKSVVGDELLKKGFPAIHTVGRASVFAPRLLEFSWGDPTHPRVALVGKGVCFDTGGLDLKSAAGMLLMKKDMSGAAQVLGLASLIMEMQLPLHLNVLIPVVENAVSNNAYRPGDIIKTRKGLTVLVDNTDAEGRLILCDALTYAMESSPELIIDIASLTGASSAALGYDIASFYTNNNTVASELNRSAEQVTEFLWQMPLHAAYKQFISPEIADLSNASLIGYAGSITAALFLSEFVNDDKKETDWIHFDTAAWNDRAKPGKPVGGEATVIRSLYHYLQKRYDR